MAAPAKINKIQNIFKNMEYGCNSENTELAYNWLNENAFFAYIDNPTEQPNGTPWLVPNAVKKESLYKVFVPEIDTIKTILAKDVGRKWLELESFQKVKIINKIGSEIEKNAKLFAELEILTRGILTKDTYEVIPCLAQYFHYYSSFAYSDEKTAVKSQNIAVGVMSNDTYLVQFGQFLAPALAAGCNIVLQVGTKLTPVAFLLRDLAQSAGLPEGVLRIIPSDEGELLLYLNCDKVEIVTLFVNINNAKYRGMNPSNKKILFMSLYRTPSIIFDTADLDAATEGVIDSSWKYQSLLPWTTDTILVQENIFSMFLNKLKSKMSSLEISTADNPSARISFNINCTESIESLQHFINQAKLQGIEVYQPQASSNKWCPTLFIGGKVNHNALNIKDDAARAVTVLAFRSIDEAVSLANNNGQGLWASVWSENGGVVNEVIRKLKVSNICVNGSYSFSPDVVLSPTKESGVGNFGGKEGFLEYLSFEKNKYCPCSKKTSTTPTVNTDSIVNIAKKAQESWQKVSKIEKQMIFQEFAEYLQQLIVDASETGQKWSLKHVYAAIKETQRENLSMVLESNLTSFREPRGVIVIDRSEISNATLILTALFEGNSLIILTASNVDPVLKLLSGKLPSGVLILVPYDSTVLKKLSANKKISCYFGDDGDHVFGCLPLRDSKNYRSVAKNGDDVYGKVGFVKNVWSDIGKSATCSF